MFFIIIHFQGYLYMGKEYDGIHRLTFLIGLDGKISHVFNKFKTKDHHQVVLDFLKTDN
jgi:peroxiredoxin Q/BCP